MDMTLFLLQLPSTHTSWSGQANSRLQAANQDAGVLLFVGNILTFTLLFVYVMKYLLFEFLQKPYQVIIVISEGAGEEVCICMVYACYHDFNVLVQGMFGLAWYLISNGGFSYDNEFGEP